MEIVSSRKPALRQWAKQVRAAWDWHRLSSLLTERLRTLPEITAARDILLYLALPAEVRVEGLAEAADGDARRWYAPRCADPGRRLAIYPYTPGRTPLRPGPFGIPEPDPALAAEADPGALDAIVVPALLLSEAGDRLGYGGGYYDRFLPRRAAHCTAIGVLPDALVLPDLPRDPWDQPLDVIVTETRLLRPGSCCFRDKEV